MPYTPSQTVGPFFTIGLCVEPTNLLVPPGSEGAIRVSGRVVDGGGEGVPDAMVEIWQATPPASTGPTSAGDAAARTRTAATSS